VKQQIQNYTFDKTAKTVTFTDFTSIVLDDVLIIVDVTTTADRIVYNFADLAKGGSVATNVLTLAFNTATASYANTDKLLIFYDYPEPDYDSAGGVVHQGTHGLVVPGSGGPVAITGDASNGLDVDVTRVQGTVATSNAVTSVVGSGTEATAQRVTIATDSTGVLSVDDNGSTLSVDDGAGSLTVDNAALSVVGGGVEATALRVTVASDSTGVLSVDDNGGSLTVDGTVAVSGTVTTAETVPSTIYNGNTNVTTAATRVTLASSQAVKSITIKAKLANTGTIYVGDTSVSSANGLELQAGESVSFDLANLNTVNLDASVSGEGVRYLAVG